MTGDDLVGFDRAFAPTPMLYVFPDMPGEQWAFAEDTLMHRRYYGLSARLFHRIAERIYAEQGDQLHRRAEVLFVAGDHRTWEVPIPRRPKATAMPWGPEPAAVGTDYVTLTLEFRDWAPAPLYLEVPRWTGHVEAGAPGTLDDFRANEARAWEKGP